MVICSYFRPLAQESGWKLLHTVSLTAAYANMFEEEINSLATHRPVLAEATVSAHGRQPPSSRFAFWMDL